MKNTQKIKRGKIDISELNTPPEKHEYETAKYLSRLKRKEKSNKVKILLVITRDGQLLTIKGVFDII